MGNIAELTEMYKCDNEECDATFQGKDVALVVPAKNISMSPGPMGGMMVVVDRHGGIRGVRSTDNMYKGDRFIACPKCGQVHLFGLDSAR